MATTQTVIGAPTARTEGPDKVTGLGRYGVDVHLPGTLWCKVLRSPYPHARILRVDASRARALPGVRCVLTGEDVRGMRTGGDFSHKDKPLLAWDRVLFVGDKVAAIAAEDEDVAQAALDLIEVEYEELPALLDAEAAAADDAPLLHPDFNSYPGVAPMETPSNVYLRLHQERGDIAEGFAAADRIVEATYRTPWVHQGYLEPHSCLVSIDPQGDVRMWVSSQMPGRNRDELARLMDLPPERVVVPSNYLGGSFGGKIDFAEAPLCYLMAQATGRPVKFVMDYAEEFQAADPRHPATIHVRAGVKDDGTLTAWEARAYVATGAYAAFAAVTFGLRNILDVAGPYRIPHVRLDLYHVYTNTVPCGFARAPGSVQGIFAGESHMDALARAIGMDPLEFRLKNVIHEGEELGSGRRYQAIRAEETLRAAAEASGYSDPRPAGVGRGIAIGQHSQGGGEAHATVAIHPDGRIAASFSTFDPGGGTYTLVAQVVAQELDVPVERVRVAAWSTDQGPVNGVGGSRGARVTSVAAHEAAASAKERLSRLAAEFLGWSEEHIAFQGGDLVHQATGERVPLERIAQRAGEPIQGQGDVNEAASPYTSFGTQVAEVAVDRETGQARLLRLTTVHETGRVLNPIAFGGQVEGGVVTGIGGTLMEELAYEDGRVANPSFAEMKMPTMRDIPELRTVLLESDVGDGPYKVRGIGEHSNIMTAAAIANAIADAVGVRIPDLPITAEVVYRALKGPG